MTDKDAATVLEEAADLLLIRGVCRDGTYGKPDGPRCAIGAIAEVSAREVHQIEGGPAVAALDRHLARNLTRWNDETADDFEVIDTLRHVAKDLRNEATS